MATNRPGSTSSRAARTGALRRAQRPGLSLRATVFVLCLQASWGAVAQIEAPEEARSFGVAPPPGYRAVNYHAPTPDELPGARVLRTAELQVLLQREPKPMLLDVLSGPAHRTLPRSIWLHNGGLGDYSAEENKRFLDTIARIAGHDKQRPLVFFCSGIRCWLSYNAALRALRGGYANVFWYRGGIDAWRAADLPTVTADHFQW